MKKSEQKTTDRIKSEKDIASEFLASRRTRRKLLLSELIDKFEKAKFETKASHEDREWLNSPPVGKESL